MSEKKCEKCGRNYNGKTPVCPYCGAVDNRRALQIRDLETKARNNPQIGVRCLACNSIFPNDQTKCPFCYATVGHGSVKSIAGRSRSDLDKIETPIDAHFAGRPIPTKQRQAVQPKAQLMPCAACGHKLSPKAEKCPSCGQPTGVHICPKCGGANTKPISGASKATSVVLWGPFAANKVLSKFQCKDCGHKF